MGQGREEMRRGGFVERLGFVGGVAHWRLGARVLGISRMESFAVISHILVRICQAGLDG